MRLEEIDHTADVAYDVEGPSLEVVFRASAIGLLQALGLEPAEAPSRQASKPLALRAADRERLLVAWLRELLWAVQAQGLAPWIGDIGIDPGTAEAGESREAALQAAISWKRLDRPPTREIKGVTYHSLRLERSGEGWRARIVLDV